MAVGPDTLPTLHPVAGFKIGIASAGIKRPGRRDIVVMEIPEGASVAGVFTKNQFCAAPVDLAKANMAKGCVRYLLTNTGNANAGTGEQGMADAIETTQELAKRAGVSAEQIMPYSLLSLSSRWPLS